MKALIEYIKKEKIGKNLREISLKPFNTYKVNTKAKMIIYPSNVDKLSKLLQYLKDNKIKHLILGKGSNVIFATDYYDGIIIKLDYLNNIEINGTTVKVGAGYSLAKLALKTAKIGLSGLEFAAGIPGSIGGSVYMNAGAYGSDMGYIVTKIKVLTPDYKIKTMFNKALNFHYRDSFLKHNKDYICLEATLKLKRKSISEISERINSRREKRIETQPLEFPSAGSSFRNPEGTFAGKLIEDAGLKGMRVNDAEISTKHANFIINRGKCKGKDIEELINLIKKTIKEKDNIDLIIEQEIIK